MLTVPNHSVLDDDDCSAIAPNVIETSFCPDNKAFSSPCKERDSGSRGRSHPRNHSSSYSEMAAIEEFKVILVGESGVGKTTFLVRFADSKFQNAYESTVGVDCRKVKVNVEDTVVELQIWDTAGQERFKSIVNRFFRAAHGAIIMYDVTKKESFDEVPWWYKEIREHLIGAPIFIVGNKNDDANQHEVLEELVQDFAEENRLYLYHSSARDDVNVKEVFQDLATMMLTDRKKAQEPEESTRMLERSVDSAYDVRKIFLRSDEPTPKRGCCGYFEPPDTKAHVV